MRIQFRLVILVALVVFTLCFVFDNVLCYRCEGSHVHNRQNIRPTEAPWFRRVTKSLAELPKVPELSDHILMFNRAPKSGGETIVLMLQMLQGYNSFRHIRLAGTSERMNNQQQGAFREAPNDCSLWATSSRIKSQKIHTDSNFSSSETFSRKIFTKEVSDIIREQAIPLSFDKTVYFTNFTEFSIQSPIYINLIREPFDSVVSRMSTLPLKETTVAHQTKLVKSVTERFANCWIAGRPRCSLFDGSPYEFAIPYFCGHDQECLKPNSGWALTRAKENVDRYYPVVGLLEHLNETALVLENRLPMFFKGASTLYAKKISESQKNWKRKTIVKKIVEERLKDILASEYEFYNWIKSRLFSQVNSHITSK